MFESSPAKLRLPTPREALPGRAQPTTVANTHVVTGAPMKPPFANMELAMFGLGCFWGAERIFWQSPGVFTTMVGYAGGYTPNPTYEEVCSGLTGHNEVVRLAFDPQKTTYDALLRIFWESHNPTQAMRQGNDIGTQYRSGIYWMNTEQKLAAERTLQTYQETLFANGQRTPIATEICPAPTFYYAEDYHQQYLAKNPQGYCGLGGTGVCYPNNADTNAQK